MNDKNQRSFSDRLLLTRINHEHCCLTGGSLCRGTLSSDEGSGVTGETEADEPGADWSLGSSDAVLFRDFDSDSTLTQMTKPCPRTTRGGDSTRMYPGRALVFQINPRRGLPGNIGVAVVAGMSREVPRAAIAVVGESVVACFLLAIEAGAEVIVVRVAGELSRQGGKVG